MGLRKLFGAAAAAFALLASPALANPKNALDAYVARPDPSFAWHVDHPISGPGYHGAVLALTSQTWLDGTQVARTPIRRRPRRSSASPSSRPTPVRW